MEDQNKLAGLQLARGLAALSIAYFHSWNVTMAFPDGTDHPIYFLKQYGWIAVDFFFAISGFVICMLATKLNFSRSEFLLKRAFRIYPLWIATTAFFFYLACHPRGFQVRDTWEFIAYSFTLLPTHNYPFYDVGWSLQHELMFYGLAAILIPTVGIYGLAGYLVLGFAASKFFELPWWFNQFSAYYLHFAAGIAAFVLYPHAKRISPVIWLIMGFSMLWFFTSKMFGAAAFPVALIPLVIGFATLRLRSGSTIDRVSIRLGNSSYGIYLIHTLVFWYCFWMLRTWWKWAPIWSAEIFRFGSLAFVVLLAGISWRKFEKPVIEAGNEWVSSLKLRAIARIR